MILQKKKKIIIYSGAFNPPHLGHAIMLEITARAFPCDEVWIMPTANRRDKKIGVAGIHRVRMLKIMQKKILHPPRVRFKISHLELDRPRLTATYETKRELERLYPNYEFYFLVGSDIVGDIEKKWVQGKKLFKTGKFIIFKRYLHALPKKLPPQSIVLEKESRDLDFSSTSIRDLLKQKHSGVPYITPEVARYIKKHKLYQ